MRFLVYLAAIALLFGMAGCGSSGSAVEESGYPVAVIQTGFGDIEVELYDDKAPVTVENFLKYVDAGLYENGRFHRVVNHENDPNQPVHKINVIQGGRTRQRGGQQGFPAIPLERTNITGIKHKNGVISMARSGPDTATSDFFICINDQPSLDYDGMRNQDGQGFGAFGKVVRGMDVVLEIYKQPYEGQSFSPVIAINNIVRR
ncbi:peptidylprolyl isomerase [candidate division KSB1 bacterium]